MPSNEPFSSCYRNKKTQNLMFNCFLCSFIFFYVDFFVNVENCVKNKRAGWHLTWIPTRTLIPWSKRRHRQLKERPSGRASSPSQVFFKLWFKLCKTNKTEIERRKKNSQSFFAHLENLLFQLFFNIVDKIWSFWSLTKQKFQKKCTKINSHLTNEFITNFTLVNFCLI